MTANCRFAGFNRQSEERSIQASKWGGIKAVEEPLGLKQKPTGHVSVMTNLVRHLLHGEKLITPRRVAALRRWSWPMRLRFLRFEKRWVKIPHQPPEI